MIKENKKVQISINSLRIISLLLDYLDYLKLLHQENINCLYDVDLTDDVANSAIDELNLKLESENKTKLHFSPNDQCDNSETIISNSLKKEDDERGVYWDLNDCDDSFEGQYIVVGIESDFVYYASSSRYRAELKCAELNKQRVK